MNLSSCFCNYYPDNNIIVKNKFMKNYAIVLKSVAFVESPKI